MKKGLNFIVLLIVDLLALAISLEFSIFTREEILPPFFGFPEYQGNGILIIVGLSYLDLFLCLRRSPLKEVFFLG
jgi:hypothetical protein